MPGSEIVFEIDLSEPSKELMDWAKKKIKEDPDKTSQQIEDLRDLIYSKGECIPHRMDDAFLLRFLRGRHFRLYEAYKLLVNYYEFRIENPTYYKGSWMKFLENNDRYDIVNVPPYRDQAGRRMVIYKFGNWDPEILTTEDLFKGTVMLLEMSLLEPRTQILGGICIIDLSSLSINQAWYMSPGIAQKIFQIAVTSFPFQIMAIHIINQSWIFETVFNLIRPLLTEGMKKRIIFHGNDLESLHKYVDPKCLPREYGGVHPPYKYDDWISTIKGNKIVMEEMKSLGYKSGEDENTDEDS